jgi:hypothetical protein
LSCSGVPICVEDTAGLVSGLDPSVLIGRHACSVALVVCVLWLRLLIEGEGRGCLKKAGR